MADDLGIKKDLDDRKRKLSNKQNTSGKSIHPERVDALVEEIFNRELGTKPFQKWYCRRIYDLGPEKVKQLMERCRDANDPARLFSHLLKNASPGS